MSAQQLQINALIDAIAGAILNGGSAEAATTATGLRRACWAGVSVAQQAQVLTAARRRAMSESERR